MEKKWWFASVSGGRATSEGGDQHVRETVPHGTACRQRGRPEPERGRAARVPSGDLPKHSADTSTSANRTGPTPGRGRNLSRPHPAPVQFRTSGPDGRGRTFWRGHGIWGSAVVPDSDANAPLAAGLVNDARPHGHSIALGVAAGWDEQGLVRICGMVAQPRTVRPGLVDKRRRQHVPTQRQEPKKHAPLPMPYRTTRGPTAERARSDQRARRRSTSRSMLRLFASSLWS